MALSIISWNCHGYRTHTDDIKDLINVYKPVCVGLQETLLNPTISPKIKHYNFNRKDNIQNARATGGVALMHSTSFPVRNINLNSPLQAVAIQIQINTLLTICSIYLPPSEPIQQIELNKLVDELPGPFIIMGDMNGTMSCGAVVTIMLGDYK